MIIITTIQKFPFILDGISDLRQKNFAVVIDEAHSSQSGTAHDNMNRVMGRVDQEDEDGLDVANKYLTGFDQPKLAAMYVDKKLQGVMAVQALSRLNRSAPHLGKKTEDLFILDFFNRVEEIQTAFNDRKRTRRQMRSMNC